MLYDLGEMDILGSLKFTLRERLKEIFWRREIIEARNKERKRCDSIANTHPHATAGGKGNRANKQYPHSSS